MDSMAEHNTKGEKSEDVNAPVQIFFVPNEDISFDESKHDIREDFLSLKSDTTLYKVYALERSEKYSNFSSYEIKNIPKHIEDSKLIGEIVLTSPFIASKFGDTGIFFKHDAE